MVEKVGPSVAGLTDNKDSNTVVILISTEGYLFESTLHHEIMHYIDCYLADKIGAEAIEASMNELNPEGFTYGNKKTSMYIIIQIQLISYQLIAKAIIKKIGQYYFLIEH